MKAYDEAIAGWNSCIEELRGAARMYAALECENAALREQIDNLQIKPCPDCGWMPGERLIDISEKGAEEHEN